MVSFWATLKVLDDVVPVIPAALLWLGAFDVEDWEPPETAEWFLAPFTSYTLASDFLLPTVALTEALRCSVVE